MTQTDLIEYVRTAVRGNFAAQDEVEKKLDAEGWDGFPHFLATVFFMAVDKRFSRPVDAGDIVRFVADIRAGLGDDAHVVDQLTAERLVRSVVDDNAKFDMRSADQDMVARIQTLASYRILTDSDMTDEQLDAFLQEAARLANRM